MRCCPHPRVSCTSPADCRIQTVRSTLRQVPAWNPKTHHNGRSLRKTTRPKRRAPRRTVRRRRHSQTALCELSTTTTVFCAPAHSALYHHCHDATCRQKDGTVGWYQIYGREYCKIEGGENGFSCEIDTRCSLLSTLSVGVGRPREASRKVGTMGSVRI